MELESPALKGRFLTTEPWGKVANFFKEMIQMNLFTKQKQTYRYQKETMVTKGETQGKGINQELGSKTHIQLYIKSITSNNLL